MGGHKRKLGVERKSQALQQRNFFAQRREELERKEAGDAVGAGGTDAGKRLPIPRYEDPRPQQRARKSSSLRSPLGRDVVALRPIKKAASGVIRMRSAAAPIHDFENVESANVTGISAAPSKLLHRSESLNVNAPVVLLTSSGSNRNTLGLCLSDSYKSPYFHKPNIAIATNHAAEPPRSQDTAVKVTWKDNISDTESRFEAHSDYSNMLNGRKPIKRSPENVSSPLAPAILSTAEASCAEEDAEELPPQMSPTLIRPKIIVEERETEDSRELDMAMRSPAGESPKVENVGSCVRALLGDENCQPVVPATLPKSTSRPLQLEPDSFNASVESFEAGLFKVSESDVHAFCRRPTVRAKPTMASDGNKRGAKSQSPRIDAKKSVDTKDKLALSNDDTCEGPLGVQSSEQFQQGDTVFGDRNHLSNRDELYQKVPTPPLCTFPPATNPFTAARDREPVQKDKAEKSIVRCNPVDNRPSKRVLPSIQELFKYKD